MVVLEPIFPTWNGSTAVEITLFFSQENEQYAVVVAVVVVVVITMMMVVEEETRDKRWQTNNDENHTFTEVFLHTAESWVCAHL